MNVIGEEAGTAKGDFRGEMMKPCIAVCLAAGVAG